MHLGAISNGFFGQVLLAINDDDEKVAVKCMSKLKVASSGAINDVFAERDVMIKGSPYIIELYRAFQDTENLYFELELCEVGSLLDVYGKNNESKVLSCF